MSVFRLIIFGLKQIEMGSEIEKEYVNSIVQLLGFFILLFVVLALQF